MLVAGCYGEGVQLVTVDIIGQSVYLCNIRMRLWVYTAYR